jgi:hypothetical protein
MNSIHQLVAENNPLIALIADGLHYNEAIREWEVWLDGEVTAWAADYGTAERSYFEMLRLERVHAQRNPANAAIPPTWWNVNTGEFTARVDRETGEVSYEDHR